MRPLSWIFNISGVCILSTHVRMWRMLIRHRRTRVSESKQTTICENRGRRSLSLPDLYSFRPIIAIFYHLPVKQNRQGCCREPSKRPCHPDSGTSKLWCQQMRKPDPQNQVRNRCRYKIGHGPGAADNTICHQLYGNHKIQRRYDPQK